MQWPGKADINADKLSAMEKAVQAIVQTREVLDKPGAFPPDHKAFCHVHNDMCCTRTSGPDPAPLTIDVVLGGTSCLAHTSMGDRREWCGDDMKHGMVYVAETKCTQDISFFSAVDYGCLVGWAGTIDASGVMP